MRFVFQNAHLEHSVYASEICAFPFSVLVRGGCQVGLSMPLVGHMEVPGRVLWSICAFKLPVWVSMN